MEKGKELRGNNLNMEKTFPLGWYETGPSFPCFKHSSGHQHISIVHRDGFQNDIVIQAYAFWPYSSHVLPLVITTFFLPSVSCPFPCRTCMHTSIMILCIYITSRMCKWEKRWRLSFWTWLISLNRNSSSIRFPVDGKYILLHSWAVHICHTFSSGLIL